MRTDCAIQSGTLGSPENPTFLSRETFPGSMIPEEDTGTSLAVQWLRLHTSTAGGMGSIPGQGRSCMPCSQKKKKILPEEDTNPWV